MITPSTIQPLIGLAAFAALWPARAVAADYPLGGEFQATLHGTASFGTMIRTASPSPDAYPYITSVVTGAPSGHLIGNTGAADLNFRKDRPVSTVLKGSLGLDVHNRDFGLFVRADGWTDFALENDGRAYGNYPNRYQAGAPLSDNGFAQEARFSNLLIRDAYLHGHLDLAEGSPLDLRLGRQILNWGKALLTGGGINAAINPADLAAQLRPGALPEEGKLPVGMLSASLAVGQHWGFDAFAEYEFRPAVMPGCGTFFDVASLLPTGCAMSSAVARTQSINLTTVESLSERMLIDSGYYIHRNPDVLARNSGQWGLSARYTAPEIRTEFRLYALNTHGTTPLLKGYVENVGGAVLPATLPGAFERLSNPNGIKYAVTYAEDIHLWGAAFDTRPNPLIRFYGEAVIRTNAPVSWNGNDVLNTTLTRNPNSMIDINKHLNSLPAGASYDVFDRYRVTNLTLGASKVLPRVFGAEHLVITGEVGLSHISDLPDPAVMRYGRSFAYGTAPYVRNGVTLTPCFETLSASGIPHGVPGKSCTSDGFVSSDAWGYRLHLLASYPGALFGATLTPSLYFAHDVDGYSYDGSFSKGRLSGRLGLRAEWAKTYFTDIQYTHFGGGKYNILADRSNLSLVAGMRF